MRKLIPSFFNLSQFTEEDDEKIQESSVDSTVNTKTENDFEAISNEIEYQAEIVQIEKVVTSKVKSTGCGPSPDREVEEVFMKEISVDNSDDGNFSTEINETAVMAPSDSTKVSVSIGTSPPPQTCGTQVSRC